VIFLRHYFVFIQSILEVCFFHAQTRALSQNVTNAPKGALTPNLENVEVTVQNKLHYVENSPVIIQE